jgi:hypothetical protein
MWNYHAFLRALIIGLQSGRTVIPVARSPGPENEWEVAAFLGCENLHLGCFFHITKCSLEDSRRRARLLSEMPFMSGYHWPYKNATERERLSLKEVLKLRAFKGWEYDWRYTFPAGEKQLPITILHTPQATTLSRAQYRTRCATGLDGPLAR